MGGRMPFYRAVGRNNAYGDYGDGTQGPVSEIIRGDLTRMIRDELADCTIAEYAAAADVQPEQVALILRMVFDVPEPGCVDCAALHERVINVAHSSYSANTPQRCVVHASQSPGISGDAPYAPYANDPAPALPAHQEFRERACRRWR